MVKLHLQVIPQSTYIFQGTAKVDLCRKTFLKEMSKILDKHFLFLSKFRHRYYKAGVARFFARGPNLKINYHQGPHFLINL